MLKYRQIGDSFHRIADMFEAERQTKRMKVS